MGVVAKRPRWSPFGCDQATTGRRPAPNGTVETPGAAGVHPSPPRSSRCRVGRRRR
ncbi:hypothetical protein Ae706Ps2_1705 [Pseudonocardia sp. Ae706_Ps2]|nr:hypothetical protein Ae706Ps2_1705 [Pseudonocardia sp. Ae706_Ps2]